MKTNLEIVDIGLLITGLQSVGRTTLGSQCDALNLLNVHADEKGSKWTPTKLLRVMNGHGEAVTEVKVKKRCRK